MKPDRHLPVGQGRLISIFLPLNPHVDRGQHRQSVPRMSLHYKMRFYSRPNTELGPFINSYIRLIYGSPDSRQRGGNAIVNSTPSEVIAGIFLDLLRGTL